MAAYPTSPAFRHRKTPTRQREVDVSEAGTPRAVDLSDKVTYTIELTYPFVTEAELDALEAFFEANHTAYNTITLRGDVYDVLFQSFPVFEEVSPTYFAGTVVLVGNKR